jgi:hypothetical protein
MMIALHKNARTTPATRAEIAASTDTAVTLAQRYGIGEGTVYKWKSRDSFHDASHTPHRLQTTLTPAQEKIVVELSAYSTRWRTPFHGDGGHRSTVIADTVPR